MNPVRDSVDDLELEAYLNDQLDLAGRTAVERVLARNPEQAAQIMADLHVRNTLRAMLENEPARGETRLDLAARRLERGLIRSHLTRGMRQAALAAACIALGWLVHWQLDSFGIATTEAASPPPRFVAEALQAHRTSLLRSLMGCSGASGRPLAYACRIGKRSAEPAIVHRFGNLNALKAAA